MKHAPLATAQRQYDGLWFTRTT